jgi:hypothetical protein
VRGGECSGVYRGDYDASIPPCVLGVVYGRGRHCNRSDKLINPLVPFD